MKHNSPMTDRCRHAADTCEDRGRKLAAVCALLLVAESANAESVSVGDLRVVLR